ncbi:MAG: penicillin-binding transpeptidase domain-containing protein [Candidatus Campbellbacteria bacterium]|nr:penicillin-binding transpeptidase domain-containing protein [Candidatus Campbellbacteria bacterium]
MRTQFSTNCEPHETTRKESPCFSPENYNFSYPGPVTMRQALAASQNIPAVKTLYLAGARNTIKTANDMGISTLNNDDADLSLVLGSGEVKLLEMTNAYGVFANGGIYYEPTGILEIEDRSGEKIEEFEKDSKRVLPEQNALQITDILSDRGLRVGTFGPGTALDIPNPNIAVKTGTTNNYRDVWTIGYNTDMSLGIWGGNNNNDPIVRRVSTYVISPLWREILDIVTEKYPGETFREPNKDYSDINKPILTGSYTGGIISGGRIIDRGVHSILHWTNPSNPRGPVPSNPNSISQYSYWEYPVSVWSRGQIIDTEDEEIEIEEDENEEEEDENNSNEDVEANFEVEGLNSTYDIGDEMEFVVDSRSVDIEKAEAVFGEESNVDSTEAFRFTFETYYLDEGVYSLEITVYDHDDQQIMRSFEVEIED